MTTPTAEASEKILTRIRGLLAKAEGGATEAERQAYAEKAAELMAKHAVDLAMVSDSAPVDDPVVYVILKVSSDYENAKAILANVIAKAMSCRLVHGQGELHLFGHRSDVDHVKFLFTHLLVQAMRGAMNSRPAYSRSASQVAAYRRAWFAGFATAIDARMTASRDEAVREHTAAGTGTELVLVRRAEAATVRLREVFPKTRTSRTSYSSGSGFAGGIAAGRRADFGGGRLAGGRAALPR